MNKCTGIMGRIFGHKWQVKREVIQPQVRRYEDGVYTCGQAEFMEYGQCKRCGAVTGEKK